MVRAYCRFTRELVCLRFPTEDKAMRCFEAFPGGPGAVRAVLVGKAPYPNAQQAHGLALSAPDGAKKPPCVNTWLCEFPRVPFLAMIL